MFRNGLKFILSSLVFLFSVSVYAQSMSALFNQAGDPVAGNPKGKVTVAEFYDYQCSHCVNMIPVMDAVIKANPNVRFVFKEFPVRGQASELAARAALAANMQGKYYAYAHALFTTSSYLNEDTIFSIAKSQGLNMDRFKKDMTSSKVNSQLRNNIMLGRALGVNGTPAFFIGKTDSTSNNQVDFVLGEMSRSALQSAINQYK